MLYFRHGNGKKYLVGLGPKVPPQVGPGMEPPSLNDSTTVLVVITPESSSENMELVSDGGGGRERGREEREIDY